MGKHRTKVGAVLTFPEGLTEKQVREFLSEWQGELEKDGSKFVYDSIWVFSNKQPILSFLR